MYAYRVTLLVKKDGNCRFYGDYRPLNLERHSHVFPMPFVKDVLNCLGKFQWFYALDLQFGFWKIKITFEDIQKIALITKLGMFGYTVMLFSMKNATNIFSKTMTEIFGENLNMFLKVFVDDLNIHIHSQEQHLEHLCFVLLKLKEVNLKLNLRKCEFVKISLTFLGHVVSCDGTQPNLRKIKVVTNILIPT